MLMEPDLPGFGAELEARPQVVVAGLANRFDFAVEFIHRTPDVSLSFLQIYNHVISNCIFCPYFILARPAEETLSISQKPAHKAH
ncbi:hypothetical protein GHYDROH2_28320 [Geobacter hydrogenophilus]|uniref:Uncharacterized protein n=1 Tax=Geobacter hydrogenophilus TaxID=40983 RepID=A0A9W6LEB0_9BACT|nr:hypothetical protein GHYDROH2_28320 [Geobacter hydrogenophilus]